MQYWGEKLVFNTKASLHSGMFVKHTFSFFMLLLIFFPSSLPAAKKNGNIGSSSALINVKGQKYTIIPPVPEGIHDCREQILSSNHPFIEKSLGTYWRSGPRGHKGERGVRGHKGKRGARGPRGHNGSKGPKG